MWKTRRSQQTLTQIDNRKKKKKKSSLRAAKSGASPARFDSMSSSFTPGQNHSPGSSRLLQLGVAGSASRLRSSSSKKPPEPLRRAVADCLSSSHPPATSHHGAIPSIAPSEALRNLRVWNWLLSLSLSLSSLELIDPVWDVLWRDSKLHW